MEPKAEDAVPKDPRLRNRRPPLTAPQPAAPSHSLPPNFQNSPCEAPNLSRPPPVQSYPPYMPVSSVPPHHNYHPQHPMAPSAAMPPGYQYGMGGGVTPPRPFGPPMTMQPTPPGGTLSQFRLPPPHFPAAGPVMNASVPPPNFVLPGLSPIQVPPSVVSSPDTPPGPKVTRAKQTYGDFKRAREAKQSSGDPLFSPTVPVSPQWPPASPAAGFVGSSPHQPWPTTPTQAMPPTINFPYNTPVPYLGEGRETTNHPQYSESDSRGQLSDRRASWDKGRDESERSRDNKNSDKPYDDRASDRRSSQDYSQQRPRGREYHQDRRPSSDHRDREDRGSDRSDRRDHRPYRSRRSDDSWDRHRSPDRRDREDYRRKEPDRRRRSRDRSSDRRGQRKRTPEKSPPPAPPPAPVVVAPPVVFMPVRKDVGGFFVRALPPELETPVSALKKSTSRSRSKSYSSRSSSHSRGDRRSRSRSRSRNRRRHYDRRRSRSRSRGRHRYSRNDSRYRPYRRSRSRDRSRRSRSRERDRRNRSRDRLRHVISYSRDSKRSESHVSSSSSLLSLRRGSNERTNGREELIEKWRRLNCKDDEELEKKLLEISKMNSDELLRQQATYWVRSAPATTYYERDENKVGLLRGTQRLEQLCKEFTTRLLEPGRQLRELHQAQMPNALNTKKYSKCNHHHAAKSPCSMSSDSDDSEEVGSEESHILDELQRKMAHPHRLHPELWHNEKGEMNDGPLCKCSLKAQRSGIRHGIYAGEVPGVGVTSHNQQMDLLAQKTKKLRKIIESTGLPSVEADDSLVSDKETAPTVEDPTSNSKPVVCDPNTNNFGKLYHYRITISPPTNFLSKTPTIICHDGHEFLFSGFSMFSHYPLPALPVCKVVRFNIEYQILYAEEDYPENFTIRECNLFFDYMFREILELIDLDLYGQQDKCPVFHFMPRFVRELPPDGHELLPMCVVIKYLISNYRPLVPPQLLADIPNTPNDLWQDFADEVKGMIVTKPGTKPSSIRVDQLDKDCLISDKELDRIWPRSRKENERNSRNSKNGEAEKKCQKSVNVQEADKSMNESTKICNKKTVEKWESKSVKIENYGDEAVHINNEETNKSSTDGSAMNDTETSDEAEAKIEDQSPADYLEGGCTQKNIEGHEQLITEMVGGKMNSEDAPDVTQELAVEGTDSSIAEGTDGTNSNSNIKSSNEEPNTTLKPKESSDNIVPYPVIVHFGIRPPQLSYAGSPEYQKAWREYVKHRHLIANLAKPAPEDKAKLANKEAELQRMRTKGNMKRDVTTTVSSEGFQRTGVMCDVVQHAMLIPVLSCHLRFHRSLDVLEDRIGYKFNNRSLLQLALTHPSYRFANNRTNIENFGTNPDHARNSLTNCGIRQPEYGDRKIHYMSTKKRGINTLMRIMSRFACKTEKESSINHYERLEFLGDAVVEFVSTIHLFHMFRDLEEGGLATYRAALVQNQHLSLLAKVLSLDAYLLYAHGSDLCHDFELNHALANCFEALMGALYLDGGIHVADRVFGQTVFGYSPELLEAWDNYPPHLLQEQEPDGDRNWIDKIDFLKNLTKFEESVGIEFDHIRILARAFTDRSVGYTILTLGSNQRLEFLGDSVLQLVASNYLYKHFPDHHEGHLSLLRSSLVNNNTQSVVCDDLGMTSYARYAVTKGDLKVKDRADLLEAFLGALYVDKKSLEWVEQFCKVCFFPRLQTFIMNQEWNDPKSKLQQCCLTLRGMNGTEPDIPTYKVVECKGPTNTRTYSVAVYFRNKRMATASGHSIQQAEMNAAQAAMEKCASLFPQLDQQKKIIAKKVDRETLDTDKIRSRRTGTPERYKRRRGDGRRSKSTSPKRRREKTENFKDNKLTKNDQFTSNSDRSSKSRSRTASPVTVKPRSISSSPSPPPSRRQRKDSSDREPSQEVVLASLEGKCVEEKENTQNPSSNCLENDESSGRIPILQETDCFAISSRGVGEREKSPTVEFSLGDELLISTNPSEQTFEELSTTFAEEFYDGTRGDANDFQIEPEFLPADVCLHNDVLTSQDRESFSSDLVPRNVINPDDCYDIFDC